MYPINEIISLRDKRKQKLNYDNNFGKLNVSIGNDINVSI